jgi:hypothetical protein
VKVSGPGANAGGGTWRSGGQCHVRNASRRCRSSRCQTRGQDARVIRFHPIGEFVADQSACRLELSVLRRDWRGMGASRQRRVDANVCAGSARDPQRGRAPCIKGRLPGFDVRAPTQSDYDRRSQFTSRLAGSRRTELPRATLLGRLPILATLRVSALSGRSVRLEARLACPAVAERSAADRHRTLPLAPGTRQPVTPAPRVRRFGTPSRPRILRWTRSWGSSTGVKEPPHHGSKED